MYCIKCGMQLKNEMRFCPQCGTPVRTKKPAAEKVIVDVQPQPTAEISRAYEAPQMTQQQPVQNTTSDNEAQTKLLTIAWRIELKNSVPFYVNLNGNRIGIIKRGKQIHCNIGCGEFELYCVPKAPKLFGWNALRVHAVPGNSSNPSIELSVGLVNSQLHVNSTGDVSVLSEIFCKKY